MANQSTEQELLAALQQSATIIQRHKKALAAYHEPIAIIGMGCHYPGGVETPDHFWQQLLAGFDAIGELSPARALDFVGESTPPAGFLNAVDQFDPSFFGLAPREVVVMDPAHRLLLETTWQALEATGIVPAELLNREVGVFIGGGASGYTKFCLEQGSDLYTATGNASSAAAGRISYLLGITGPCVAIDTACSSSLTAIHLACQSLRNGECRMAVAGGVNLLLDEDWTAMFTNGNMLSADARCKTFDAAANGYVRGEGCGILILKRLADAQADGDNIQAVIRGTAVNQDGPSGGLTVPNGPAQERVIRLALADANVKPEQISYIEAHGTGTPLGDPIEIGALNAVFKARSTPLYVGSVKTNVGHLEMAAGVAGVMKLVLALQHGLIPPHLHLQTPNPHIDWAASPVQVPTTTTAWPRPADGSARIGGVSSFGFSGTNAHIIVAEAPRGDKETAAASTCGGRQGDKETGRPVHLFTLAAKQEAALMAYAERYRDFLGTQPELDLADLCYTTHVGRSHYAHRLTLTVDSVAALQAQLAAYVATGEAATLSRGALVLPAAPPKVAFLFTGQGAQYVNMGRELYASEPSFRATIDRCEEVLREALGESLLAVLYPETGDANYELRITHHGHASVLAPRASRITLDDTTYTQPALFVLEYALAMLWQSWGIQPAILIGHSVGEVVAACVAGVFSLADGLKLIAARGRLMGALPQDGAMVSLLTDEARVREAIAPYRTEVAIAAVNGPESIVISGERARVLALAEQLAATGVKTRQLTVSHAFHSPLMEPMLDTFRAVAESISYHTPRISLVSNVTGKVAGAEITTPAYWVRHVREAVRFADGVATLHEQGIAICLEIGPKPVLLGMAAQVYDQATPSQPGYPLGAAQGRSRNDSLPKLGGGEEIVVTTPLLLPSLRDGVADWQQLLESLGNLYTQGVAIDWQALDRAAERRKIVLPTYPFQRQRYWARRSQSLSQVAVQSRVMRWLNEGNVAALTEQLLTMAPLTAAEQELAPKLLALLAQQHQQQVAAQAENVVANYYDAIYEVIKPGLATPNSSGQRRDDFLTFGLFPEIVGGFSWFNPATDAHAQLAYQAQKALRALLFRSVDFTACRYVLDFGCGHGTDLIGLAQAYPQLSLQGYTISAQQAGFATARVQEQGLAERIQIFNRDSAHDPFVGMVDVAFGFEVAHHIKDKAALFANLAAHLNPGGYLILADFIAHMPAAIDHEETSSYFVTKAEWAALLSAHQLQLVRHIDVSHEIANYLYNPDFDPELRRLMPTLLDENINNAYRSYHQLGKLLRRELASYVLLLAQKQTTLTGAALSEWNLAQLAAPVSYTDVTPTQWLYEVNWIATDHTSAERAPALTVTPTRSSGTWLILADRQGVGAALAQRFTANGDHAILVYPGEQCALGAAGWQMRPLVAADLEQILRTIPATAQPLQGVIHLWSLAADPSDTLSDTALEQTMLLSCGSTLTLVQTLAAMTLAPQLWLVTQGVQRVAAATMALSLLPPAPAALWGLGGVIAQEQPAFNCMRIDLDAGTTADRAATLWQAITHPDQDERQVAYRQQQRYVARLQRLCLDPTAPPMIHADASYLITGGLGALGLQVAEWLVAQGARTLALVSRRATIAATDQAVIEAWRAQGVQVQVLQADVANGASVAHLLQTLATTCPPLRGIIHAAGVLDDGILTQQQWARFEQVMAPKVKGSWHLHQLTQGLPLDFFVCFSSAAALFGSPGQGNYAAANAFMDALCHYRRQQGLPALSINWGAWGGTDDQGGMAARLGTDQQTRLRATGMGLIAPAQGVALLSTLLAQQGAQVAVMPVHWKQFQAQLSGTPAPAFLRELLHPDYELVQPTMGQDELRTGLLAAAPNRRLAYLTTYLQEQVARILRLVEPPLPRDRFFDIGMDSLMAVELRNRLQRSTGIVLSATLFFKYPNIEELALYFLEELTASAPVASAMAGAEPIPFWAKAAESSALSDDEGTSFADLSETEEDAEIQAALAKLTGQLAA